MANSSQSIENLEPRPTSGSGPATGKFADQERRFDEDGAPPENRPERAMADQMPSDPLIEVDPQRAGEWEQWERLDSLRSAARSDRFASFDKQGQYGRSDYENSIDDGRISFRPPDTENPTKDPNYTGAFGGISGGEPNPAENPYDLSGASYAGQGPRWYRRADDRIKSELAEKLTIHPAIDASEIEIEVNGGNVILGGSVPNRTMKNMAEDVVAQSAGVHQVRNSITVRSEPGIYTEMDE